MKIFGYEIKKIPKIKKVVIDTTSRPPIKEIRLEGDGWKFSDHTNFLPLVISHFINLSNREILPEMTTEQKVHVMKIFYKDLCEFEII